MSNSSKHVEDLLQEHEIKPEKQNIPVVTQKPIMKISDVYSEVKTEIPDNQTLKFIKVKTPSQLNGTFHHVPPKTHKPGTRQVLVKRLGSTTIARSVPGVNLQHEILQAQLRKINAARINTLNKSHTTTTRSEAVNKPQITARKLEPVNNSQITARLEAANKPQIIAEAYYKTDAANKSLPVRPAQIVDHRDSYIRHLLDQNREMKKMLIEFRREAGQIHLKMRRWTVSITDVLNRVQNIKIPVMKIVDKSPLTKPSPSNKTQLFRTPVLPIKLLSTLKQFEMDLKNKQYFDFVFQKVMVINTKMRTDRVPSMFSNALQSIIDPTLLGNFVWYAPVPKGTHPVNPPKLPLSLKFFIKFLEFFARVVQAMSMYLYRRNIDPRAIEQFLRSKISTQAAILRNKSAKVSAAQGRPNQINSPQIVLNSFISQAESNPSPNSNDDKYDGASDSEGDGDQPTERKIQWLDDEKEAEEDNFDEFEDYQEQDESVDMQTDETSKNDINEDDEEIDEDMLDDQNIEFLKC